MSGQTVTGKVLLSPTQAVNLAWKWGKPESEDREHPDQTAFFDKLRRKVDTLGTSDSDRRYVEECIAAVTNATRSLQIIYRGREDNFKTIESLRDTKQKSLDNWEQVGLNLQSLLPRLTAVTIGGTTIGGLAEVVGKSIWSGYKSEYLLALFLLGAALSYLFTETWIKPRKIDEKVREIIELDNNRNKYFGNYISKSACVLSILFDEIGSIYSDVYSAPWPDTSDKAHIEKKLQCLKTTSCRNADDCLKKDLIHSEDWARCELGPNSVYNNCPNLGKGSRQ